MSILKEGKNVHCLEYYNFVHALIPLRKLLSLTLIPRCKNYCSRGLLSRCVTDNPGRRPREREEIERKREIRKGGKKENNKKNNRLSTGTQ